MLDIGGVRLDGPYILAPMAGISDPPFRRLCRRSGASLVCGEMISANALHFNDPKSLRMLEVFPDERPVSMQVFGADPLRLAEAARRAAAAGADIVDLNSGCPMPKVTRTGAGAALMEDEGLFSRCVEAMVGAVRVPVTVKMRLGRKAGDGLGERFARLAEAAGAAAVAVHARYAEARHGGNADLAALRGVVEAVKIPVIGNGGVGCAADARRMMEQSGCAAVMIGRAAVGNPLLFADLREGSVERRPPDLELLMAHAEMNALRYGEERGLVRLRKCMASYFRDRPNSARIRGRAYAIKSLRGLSELIAEIAAN